ncbi:hypothetical protein [Streptomyces sp. NPDC006368]|uniref:hypothetical protein n=1 Tax=Streptomyces sp. NPDC006368 TaxID=3156760 RepID=UPI0033B88F51
MADPVKALLDRHRVLCQRAVDPLEIAAGLEAHGLTDRTAARFRHRDVFSLAEELYARVPRDGDVLVAPSAADATATGAAPGASGVAEGSGVTGAGTSGPSGASRPSRPSGPSGGLGWALTVLLPGVVGGAALVGVASTGGAVRTAVGAAGGVGFAVALAGSLRRGPLRGTGRMRPGTRAWMGLAFCFLVAYAAYGDGVLGALLDGRPAEGPWPLAPAQLLGLACSVAPAAWCAHLFAVRARRSLAHSRGLADFAAGTRPLLVATVALYMGALTALLTLVGPAFGAPVPAAPAPHGATRPFAPLEEGAGTMGQALPAVALGTLLFVARLLTVHGYPRSAATGLLAAGAAEALALGSVLAGRLPGWEPLARPVGTVVGTWGAGAVPALACGAAALALLARATAVLARASAHAPT